jgi:hypothetical protein
VGEKIVMRIVKSVPGALVAIAMAAVPVMVSASERDTASKDAATSVHVAPAKAAPASQMTTVKGLKATPMSSSELKAVKGLHAHFWNPGRPFPASEPHVVNGNNLKNWSDLYGQGPVGPGYHGLCNAQANSPAIFINPGGGCGF